MCHAFLPFTSEWYSIVCLYHILFIRASFVDTGIASAFWLLGIMLLGTRMCKYLWNCWIIWKESSVNFVRNYHTIFHSGCTIFTFLPTVQKCFNLFTLSSTIVISCYGCGCCFILVILIGMRWHFYQSHQLAHTCWEHSQCYSKVSFLNVFLLPVCHLQTR